MSNEQSGRGIFSFLVVILFVIIGLQLWYMLDIKKQLETIQGEYDALHSIINGDTSSSDTSSSEGSTMSAASDDENTPNDIQQAEAKQHQATTDNNETDVTPTDNTQTTQQLQPSVSQSQSRNINPYYPPFRAYPEPFHGPSRGYSQGPFSRSRPDPYSAPPPWVNREIYEEIRRMRQKMREDMERAFREQSSDRPSNSTRQQSNFSYHFKEDFSTPKMRVREDERHYYVSLNIPGADENDFSVKLEGQHLTVIGKQKTQKQQSDPDGQFTFSHSSTGKFKRSITLREPVDERGLQTRVENGVFMIRIPKRVL